MTRAGIDRNKKVCGEYYPVRERKDYRNEIKQQPERVSKVAGAQGTFLSGFSATKYPAAKPAIGTRVKFYNFSI